ncbi:hypothetical protein Ahy_B01g052864 isoform A [Arachis hypogaea]|uniref:Ubiquitin-like protease family profile domain-containing protein n=1 Tax=Arachis hypogaea TaxID=3818 RepID=A0A445AQN0_ARAHY|nr:hypothetical protein Ahy_B01g052864 isoform A [Arachis hypogaea]
MFKRIFILYIQMSFLLPTTINKISLVHLAPIFKMDTITEGNWGAHVLNFIIKGITDYNLKKKKAIDSCLFVLMIVYFHLSKNKDKKGEERPPEPWIANWTREQLVERMMVKMEEYMGIVKMAETKEKIKEIKKKEKKRKKPKKKKKQKRKAISSSSSETETTESEVHSTSESETEEDSEDSTRKQPTRKVKKIQSKKKKVIVEDSPEQAQFYHGYSTLSEIGTEELDEFLREKNEKSAAQGYVLLGYFKVFSLLIIVSCLPGRRKLTCDRRKAHYVSSEIIPDVNLGSDDPSSQGHTDQSSVNKPVESMLSLVVESASEPVEENMMVVRVETQSQIEALSIVPIQVCLPLSQTTTVPKIEQTPVTENEPTLMPEIEPTPEGTTKSTSEPPQKPEESTPTLPPAPSKINPAPKDAAALMMMARTASYVPKQGPMPSFSLDLTDSSQEEAATQEGTATQDGEKAKTPETPKLLEQLGDLVEKIASGGVTTKGKSPQIRKESGGEMKTYGNGLTNEFDTVCTLKAQDRYILSKVHLASLVAETHIEAEIVSAMCLIQNQQKIKRTWPLQIIQKGVFLRPKINKPFRVEDYPMFIPFLDLKKLASHRYIFAPIFHSQHWWLWLADTRKRKFYILDPYHTRSPSDERTALNTFIGYSICWGAPLKRRDKDKEIEPPYINISGQKTSYDCAIYVMKWLEIIQPENIKRLKYEWDNWTQDEVDHYRVEYASRILFNEMNQDKAEAIRGSNVIRLSKPSSLLLSPYCQINSNDIDTE